MGKPTGKITSHLDKCHLPPAFVCYMQHTLLHLSLTCTYQCPLFLGLPALAYEHNTCALFFSVSLTSCHIAAPPQLSGDLCFPGLLHFPVAPSCPSPGTPSAFRLRTCVSWVTMTTRTACIIMVK